MLLLCSAAFACSNTEPKAKDGTGGAGGSLTAKGGAVGNGGTRSGGSVGSGGAVATGGVAGSGGTAARDAAADLQSANDGKAGDGSTGGLESGSSGPLDSGTRDAGSAVARFSFFMTSQAGMARLAGNVDGFGGDLRFGKADGLAGADEICRQLAETSMPGNGKTWRAFLSVTRGPTGTPVNAIDRIGEGPWFDRLGRLVANSRADLLQTRPRGAHAIIQNDLPNEDGVPNHNPGTGIVDNHNVLTGSTAQGTIDSRGLSATCQDWSSRESRAGSPRCGVSWPRAELVHWISAINEGGCARGATPGNGAQTGPPGTVGALGGYGAIYCMALTP